MTTYSNKVTKTYQYAVSTSDNVDIASMAIPANKEVMIYAFRVIPQVANGTSNGKIELVNASNTIIASAANTGTANTAAAASQTLPVAVAASASATVLKIRTDQAVDSNGRGTVEVVMDDPNL